MENNLLENLSSAMVGAVERAAQSVVTVWGGRRPISGVVVAPERVLTVDHVLEGDEARVVPESGEKHPANVLGRDPSSDLALLKVPGLDAPALEAHADPRLGEFVLWVARPDAVMVSHGIVSATGGPVAMGRGMRLERYFRSDAQPYPGFSGGAFINLSGQMVGLGNAGVLRGQGVGIPASLVLETVALLEQGERRPRPFIGIGSQPVRLPISDKPETDGPRRGLLIVSVDPQSPAARAGLFIGDVLLSFDGATLEDTDDLQGQLSSGRIGQSFAVELLRAGARVTLRLEVGARAEKN